MIRPLRFAESSSEEEDFSVSVHDERATQSAWEQVSPGQEPKQNAQANAFLDWQLTAPSPLDLLLRSPLLPLSTQTSQPRRSIRPQLLNPTSSPRAPRPSRPS